MISVCGQCFRLPDTRQCLSYCSISITDAWVMLDRCTLVHLTHITYSRILVINIFIKKNNILSKTAKIIKRRYYSPSRHLNGNVMLSNITFYNFCNFWSVAVNILDKPLFFVFIFSVLLPILLLFVAIINRVESAIMHQHTKFWWNQSSCF